MIGGHIIENLAVTIVCDYPPTRHEARKLWVVGQYEHGEEAIVYAEPAAEELKPGEYIGWNATLVIAREGKKTFNKIGLSHEPRFVGIPHSAKRS